MFEQQTSATIANLPLTPAATAGDLAPMLNLGRFEVTPEQLKAANKVMEDRLLAMQLHLKRRG